MTVDEVAATRRALADLTSAVGVMLRRYGDTLDTRRLLADLGRLGPDLDLLCGTPPALAVVAPAPPREVIPDSAYAHDFWMDAEDEGLGRYDGGR